MEGKSTKDNILGNIFMLVLNSSFTSIVFLQVASLLSVFFFLCLISISESCQMGYKANTTYMVEDRRARGASKILNSFRSFQVRENVYSIVILPQRSSNLFASGHPQITLYIFRISYDILLRKYVFSNTNTECHLEVSIRFHLYRLKRYTSCLITRMIASIFLEKCSLRIYDLQTHNASPLDGL